MEEVTYKPIDKNKDYWIGSKGVLFSVKKRMRVKPISWQIDRYIVATVSISKVPTRVYQHRLLAKHFISNPLNLKEVNHIDFNKQNNCLSNLEWVSPKQNSRHYSENNQLKYENSKSCIIKNETLIKLLKMKSSGMSYVDMAKITGFKANTISNALRTKRAKMLSCISLV